MLLVAISMSFMLSVSNTSAFNAGIVSTLSFRSRQRQNVATLRAHDTDKITTCEVRVGELLSDLPTPCLIIELSLAERSLEDNGCAMALDNILADITTVDEPSSLFDGTLFVHTKVTSTDKRDENEEKFGSGSCNEICDVDISPQQIPGGAYLGIGLANHHVGGYYWARGMGIGASLPAHGIVFGKQGSQPSSKEKNDSTGELFWKKRGPGQDANETTEESSNSNDGKRSEWADFVSVGDTVQLVPESPVEVLTNSGFGCLVGMRRIGRPLGADPIVEKVWTRSDDSNWWISS